MNETGPDAVPPPARSSFDERMLERFEPVPVLEQHALGLRQAED
jgi:hypothetical protein